MDVLRRPSSACRHLLPVKDGEKFNFIDLFANLQLSRAGATIAASKLLPVLTGRRCRQADEGRRIPPMFFLGGLS